MLKAFQLIFEPSRTWESIEKAALKVWQVIILYLIPTILIAVAIESWGLYKLGARSSSEGLLGATSVPVAKATILEYQATQAILLVLTVFLTSKVFMSILSSMHCRVTFTNVFTAVAYSFAPYYLLIAVDALPFLPSWICRLVGAILVINAFYIGLVRVIKPEPTVAFGAFVVCSILFVIMIAVTHFIALGVLEDRLLQRLLEQFKG